MKKLIAIRIEPEDQEKLERVAKDQGRTVSDLVRHLIKRFLTKQD